MTCNVLAHSGSLWLSIRDLGGEKGCGGTGLRAGLPNSGCSLLGPNQPTGELVTDEPVGIGKSRLK